MPLASVIAGRYSATFAGTDLGITVSPGGYKVNFTPSWRKIQGTDAYADAVIDMVWRQFKDVGVSFVSKEYKAGTVSAMNPAKAYALTGITAFDGGLTGRRGSDMASTLILTATASTPAASSPASATFTGNAIIRDGVNIALLFDSTERDVPLDFEVMAITDGGSPAMPRWWSAT